MGLREGPPRERKSGENSGLDVPVDLRCQGLKDFLNVSHECAKAFGVSLRERGLYIGNLRLLWRKCPGNIQRYVHDSWSRKDLGHWNIRSLKSWDELSAPGKKGEEDCAIETSGGLVAVKSQWI